jgi:hypothetical protein
MPVSSTSATVQSVPSTNQRRHLMNRIQKTVAGVAALGALGLGGAAIAGATGGNATPSESNDAPDQQLTGSAAQQAGDAAVAAVPGGKVSSVEAADEGGATAYEVKVTDPSGKLIEVGVSKTFTVTKQAADDDQGKTDEGDGEHADDHGQSEANEPAGRDGDSEHADGTDQASAQEPAGGDGDGETADDAGATAGTASAATR